jgi:hypothetical protein
MSLITRIFVIIVALLITFSIYMKTKKKRFSEKGSIAWVVFSVLIIIVSVFPGSLDALSLFVGIQYPPSFLFLLALIFLLFIILHQSEALNILSKKNNELAQNIALLDERIRELESRAEDSTRK